MQENIIGYFGEEVPVWQSEGVTKEEAEKACNELNSAYVFLSNQHINFYLKVFEKIKEIHIVKTIANENKKFEVVAAIEGKAIIKIKYDITYSEAVFCISGAREELVYKKE